MAACASESICEMRSSVAESSLSPPDTTTLPANQPHSLSSVYSRQFFFGGGGDSPPPKNYTIYFPIGCQIVCCKFFFGRGIELQTYHGNVLMDNKHRKLFVNKQSKGCKFTPKCTKYVWRPGSDRTRWGSLCALPDSLAAMGACF